ncbi:MAG: envelope stress response membrane protein PspB [Alteraurantiacibacter sp.]
MDGVLAIICIFIGLPWLIFHYVTKWKTAATITTDDEALLEDLYSLAKRLDERMETVERLVAIDNPDFEGRRLVDGRKDKDTSLRELETLLAEKKEARQ